MNRPSAINRTVQETDIWFGELCQSLRTDNVDTAYAALRGVLHQLRDRLTIDEGAHLAAQLPVLVIGLYYHGWKPAVTPSRDRTAKDFLQGVRDKTSGHGELDPNQATQCVFALLARHVSGGEVRDVISQLPHEIRALWPDQGAWPGRGDSLGAAAARMGGIESGGERKEPGQTVPAGSKSGGGET